MNLLLLIVGVVLFIAVLLPRPPAAQIWVPVPVAPEESARGAGCLLLCAFGLAFLAVLVFG